MCKYFHRVNSKGCLGPVYATATSVDLYCHLSYIVFRQNRAKLRSFLFAVDKITTVISVHC